MLTERSTTVRSNPVRNRADWEAQRAAAAADPGRFHGDIARREIHWYDPALRAWLTWDDAAGAWTGWDASTGAPVREPYPAGWEPWRQAFDGSDPPFYRWFAGGLTNACFNEVDRHVLAGHGDEIAFHFEGDRWDPSASAGRGGPVVQAAIPRRRLLLETVKAALVLRRLGLGRGDRIALNLPNIPEQIFYTEAAKRLGILYTPVFGGFSDKTLSDRLHNAGARVVITADGAWRSAQVVPFKPVYTDPALDRYVPVTVALALVERVLAAALPAAAAAAVLDALRADLAGEITVERADVMRGVGRGLAAVADLAAPQKAAVRTAVAGALVETPPRVEAVIVVRHTRQECNFRPERDRWSHELLAAAEAELLTALGGAAAADLDALPDAAFAAALARVCPCEPLDAEWPLFIIYTSGSTGKPKGVVHVHGGYLAGIAQTMKVAFDAVPGRDVIYVVADPGWITGQSYMIAAALATRVSSIICEGAPLFPTAGRFASIIERYGATIFKAGVTFLKSVMADPANAEDVARYDCSSLRVATFCAEPVSPAVQEFGMSAVCPTYSNSYWATEHGGIVWTHFYGNADFPLRPDAHTYPLPWVFGDVWTAAPDGSHRPAADGEKGEIVITRPYPYLARCIWGDAANLGSPHWRGDRQRYIQTYWDRWPGTWTYTQGDFAIRHAGGGFSLHGRSDDVINVSGHRLGTEEIEGAILRDRQHPDSPVGNCVVVGAPHREKGLTPVAFVQTAPGRRLGEDDRRRLADLVRQEKGAVAVPSDFIEVSAFPETRSGKYMRRFLVNLINREPLGDTSTLRNPESLAAIGRQVAAWHARQARGERQRRFEAYRYVRVEYEPVGSALIAIVSVANPPVNALSERVLDELGLAVEHLARRDEVGAIVFTGEGTRAFVAGADVRQLLAEMATVQDVLPLAHKAHALFARIAGLDKPALAAVGGVALGGGCELALACHYRLAEPHAVLGQPEINLNLLPGYGGTQRLPRLVGLAAAVEIILGGRQVDALAALALGLVDQVCRVGDVRSAAVALARRHLTSGDVPLAAALARRDDPLSTAPRGAVDWAGDGPVPGLGARVRALLAQAAWAGPGRLAAAQRALAAIAHGWGHGLAAGCRYEAELFAACVVDPVGGRQGIRDFLDRQSRPLPLRRSPAAIAAGSGAAVALERRGELLPVGAPFFPGSTPIPTWQYAWAAVKDPATGAPRHGDPAQAEQLVVVPVPQPGPNEVLLYVLASEVNFNDIWALTGIPVSPFDSHDQDWHVTGSGGIGLVAAVGSEVKRAGAVAVGDLACVYSGQSDLLSPLAGEDPLQTGFRIQGYETPDGSHQQWLLVQAPQVHPKPPDLTLAAAGSYILNLGTVYRALFRTLAAAPGQTLFVEGAATGTGLEATRAAAGSGLTVVGLVSSAARAEAARAAGAAGALQRSDPHFAHLFTRVPADPGQWAAWEAAGEELCAEFRRQAGGRLADHALSHAGETAFPRSFQLLAPGGTLAFYGASSGYHFTFLGKPGAAAPAVMLRRAGLRAGEAVLIYYGPAAAAAVADPAGLEAIEAAREAGARIAVACYTEAQREFVLSLGWGEALRGAISLEGLHRRQGDLFAWPQTMPDLPDPRRETEAFRLAVRRFTEQTFKSFAAAVGEVLHSSGNPRGYPDLVVERAGHDALAVSTMLVRPFTGRVVYAEEMGGQRYSFYAPQVWMRRRRIYMPTAQIFGTHLCNAAEVVRMNEAVSGGLLAVTEPVAVPFAELPAAHQAMWENRHAGGSYVVLLALPEAGLKTKEELLAAWAAGENLPGD